MFRSVWLIARREYLGYVSAWGFWLGLILTPIGIGAGIFITTFLEEAQPSRYFAIISEDDTFSESLDWQLEAYRAGRTLFELRQALSSVAPERSRRAINAFEHSRAEGGTPEDAVESAKNVAPDLLTVFSAPPRKFYNVSSDKITFKNADQFLRARVLVDGPLGPAPLFAVFYVRNDAEGNVTAVDYVSEEVIVPDLKQAAEGAVKHMARLKLMHSVGVTPEEMRAAEALAPEIYHRRAGGNIANVEQAREVDLTDHAPYITAAFVAISLWLIIFSVINFLLTGTIEERSNKIFDSLLTSIRLQELLAGKLLGVALLSATLIGAWSLMGLWGFLQLADTLSPSILTILAAALNPSILLPAMAGFIAGYLMYGAIFLALGSLCDTIQEAQTLLSPLIILLMTPMLIIAISIQDPSSDMVHTMSWFPLFTPFLMILRAPLQPGLLEVSGQLLLMAVVTIVILRASTRIYHAGAVHGAGVADLRGWIAQKIGRKSQ